MDYVVKYTCIVDILSLSEASIISDPHTRSDRFKKINVYETRDTKRVGVRDSEASESIVSVASCSILIIYASRSALSSSISTL
jgi:hypothetical protein